jgi:hypothetical protein
MAPRPEDHSRMRSTTTTTTTTEQQGSPVNAALHHGNARDQQQQYHYLQQQQQQHHHHDLHRVTSESDVSEAGSEQQRQHGSKQHQHSSKGYRVRKSRLIGYVTISTKECIFQTTHIVSYLSPRRTISQILDCLLFRYLLLFHLPGASYLK